MVAQLYICLPDGNEKIFDLRKSQEEMKKMTVLELKNSIQEKMNISKLSFIIKPLPLEHYIVDIVLDRLYSNVNSC